MKLALPLLIVLLSGGCVWQPDELNEKADSRENVIRRGVAGEAPGVDPGGRTERIDKQYDNHELH